jgi:hypothetical protein
MVAEPLLALVSVLAAAAGKRTGLSQCRELVSISLFLDRRRCRSSRNTDKPVEFASAAASGSVGSAAASGLVGSAGRYTDRPGALQPASIFPDLRPTDSSRNTDKPAEYASVAASGSVVPTRYGSDSR